ncbi:hypothetical protein Cni_G06755 [Canna indica]|uniref:Uncharacterized protein n=1 Tax=Canna indica TaxID=4628 RepID=A0AAQ3JXU9_9LILI|nr:hypothetical protein Cni_G06755 [Canna indica]
MGSRRRRSSSFSSLSFLDEPEEGSELQWPFGRLDTLSRDELRETAYELFFACCRSSSSSGGRAPAPRHPSDGGDGMLKAFNGAAGLMTVTSRVKSALGQRARPAAKMRNLANLGSPSVPTSGSLKAKQRPITSADIMRQQMGFTEQTDARLRKTFSRFLVGQAGKQIESIVLPLELLRHLRPSELGDDYPQWQLRQLKTLEAGLLLHPSASSDRLPSAGLRLREIVSASQLKPIDTSKNSEAMRTLCNCVMTLAWRYQSVGPAEVCHWADGYPFNVHLYLALLRAVFDLEDETVVLDEVDDLLEQMKKTWPTLGINKMIHNVCFTWVLLEQYIATGLSESGLMRATLEMLDEVAMDAKRPDREPSYVRILIPTMNSFKVWAEKKLLDYHEQFDEVGVATMESLLCLALATAKIINDETTNHGNVGMIVKHDIVDASKFSSPNRVDLYIRTSVKSAFTKVYENGNGKIDSMVVEVDEDPNDTLTELAKEIENLALLEKQRYSPILERWHPFPLAVAAATLHNSFGTVLKEYIYKVSSLTNELVRLLHAAGDLEKKLIQMAEEDSAESEDGWKRILSEITSYEVDSIIFNLLKCWIDDRMRMGRECVNRARETESWNPMSKSEPYAESAVDLMKLAKLTVDEFFEIEVGVKDELSMALAEGLDNLFKDYGSFAASCGSKESYIPALPPLTRCNQESRVAQLWKKAATPCSAGVVDPGTVTVCRPCPPGADSGAQRHTASRGTQRLYVRLNTLHHILGFLHSVDKSFSSHGAPLPSHRHFDGARSSIHAVILHVAEVAAYRLIFLDSSHFFYDSLYSGSAASVRIHQTLRMLSQNLALLRSVLSERAQAQVLREVMKASFEAFLMVILAGGSARAFTRADYDLVSEDFISLKRLFATCWEGMLTVEVVEREAEITEGVVALMSLPTEKLVESFSIAVCEASGLGRSLERVPMPPTTGRWHCADPNTMLRVLCHRNDDIANRFLRRAFELPKRR